MPSHDLESRVLAIERPDPSLQTYYVISSLILGPLFLALLIPRLFRYRSLRYRFDTDGVSMSWGILFRREIHLTYRRIQDIHLTSNVIERWLRLGRIRVQTASGSERAEMIIEGLPEFQLVRDYLYSRMRGVAAAADEPSTSAALDAPAAAEPGLADDGHGDLAHTLLAVAEELRLLRREARRILVGVAMIDFVVDRVLRLLRVPAAPESPLGGPGSLRTFHASHRYLQLNLAVWGVDQIGNAVGLIIGLALLSYLPISLPMVFTVFEVLGVALFLLQLPLTLARVHLDYRMRWYMVTDRSLRVREGVLRIDEQTMSFSNIQNLSIRQGPLQRLFGISDLEVRSAGGGRSSPSGRHRRDSHLAYFRGVDDAAAIRDAILQRLQLHRDSGLGDLDEAAAVEARHHDRQAADDSAQLAAQQLLAEAKALRTDLTRIAAAQCTALPLTASSPAPR